LSEGGRFTRVLASHGFYGHSRQDLGYVSWLVFSSRVYPRWKSGRRAKSGTLLVGERRAGTASRIFLPGGLFATIITEILAFFHFSKGLIFVFHSKNIRNFAEISANLPSFPQGGGPHLLHDGYMYILVELGIDGFSHF
jgi:hypothetical protein